MLMSLKLKFFAPKVCAPPNNGLEGGKSRRYPQGPGHGGGCIAANGEDNSMIVLLVGRVTAPIGRLGNGWSGERMSRLISGLDAGVEV